MVDGIPNEKLLGIRFPTAPPYGTVRSQVLVEDSNLVALSVEVCKNLAARTERLAGKRRRRMTVACDGTLEFPLLQAFFEVTVVVFLSQLRGGNAHLI